jgi:hypothetical protein
MITDGSPRKLFPNVRVEAKDGKISLIIGFAPSQRGGQPREYERLFESADDLEEWLLNGIDSNQWFARAVTGNV